MGIRFAARGWHTQKRDYTGRHALRFDQDAGQTKDWRGFWLSSGEPTGKKRGRPPGERLREEILLLLHCVVPHCGTTKESRIPSTMSTINYTLIVNIS